MPDAVGSRKDTLIRQLQGKSKLPLPFAAGWANSGGGIVEDATYSRHGRVVRLQGRVTKTGGAPAVNNVIASLPEGFRPTGALAFTVVTGATETVGVVAIAANGQITWRQGSAVETDYTDLSGIAFVVD